MKRRTFINGGISAALMPRLVWSAESSLDVAYLNAAIWTGLSAGQRPTALGLSGNRIAAVGEEAVRSRIGTATEVVDLEGAFVMPGLIDNHTHFLRASQGLSRVDLRAASSKAEFVAMIGEAAKGLPAGRWLEGGNWDEQSWGGELPSRHWIDAVTPGTPVAVARTDLHMLVLNSLALELAGINRDTPVPPGGEILRDAEGEPTGIIKDTAKELVDRAIPEPSEAQIDAAIREGIEYGLSLGVTQIHNKELDWVTQHALRRLRAAGETGMRFYSYVPIRDWQQMARLVEEEGRGDDWVRWGGVKGLVDGSLGSRTAWFAEPYTDDPTTSGLTVEDLDDLKGWITAADAAGLQVAVHAIGDEANHWLLGVFEAAIGKNGKRDRRFLIEHAQHLLPADIPRFAELGVIPSVQPYHAIDDGRWAANRIGPERLKGTYAFKSLLDHGARLSFGSDWPVAPLNPMTGVEAAVLRQTIDGANPDGWLPEEKLPIDTALAAYTVNNAYAGFQEDRLGTISTGMLADFVVLDRDLTTIPPDQITSTRVLRTVVDGRPRFDNMA